MSTPEDKTELTQPRSAEAWDDDIDLLEAMQFAHDPSSSVFAAAKREASNDRGNSTAEGNARDSFITVPPATHTVPPVAIPALPSVVISDAAPGPTVLLAPITRVFAAALATLRESSLRGAVWATWMVTIAVVLPGGLLLGLALSSHQTAVGTDESAAGASHSAPEPDPPSTGADSESPQSIATPPTTDIAAATSSAQSTVYQDGPVLVLAPRPPPHGKRRSAPKPAESSPPAGSSDTASPVSSIPAH